MRLRKVLNGHANDVLDLAVSPDGRTALSSVGDGSYCGILWTPRISSACVGMVRGVGCGLHPER